MTAADQPLDTATVLQHAATLARVGGAAAVTAEAVAQRCRVTLEQIPEELRNSRRLQQQVSPRATLALARRIDEAVVGITEGTALLRMIGETYIKYALDEPGCFELAMFSMPTMANAKSDAARGQHNKTPFEYLESAFDMLVAEGLIEPQDVAAASMTCWSGVHGFATLATRGPLRVAEPGKIEYLTHAIVDRLVQGSINRDTTSAFV